MYPRCVASILSWRAVLVLTALATILQATSIFLSWRVSEAERHHNAFPRDEQPLPRHKKYKLSDSQPDNHAEWREQLFPIHPLQEQGRANSVIGSVGTYSTRLSDNDIGVNKGNLHLGDKELPHKLLVTLSRLARDSVVDISGQYRVATAFLAPSVVGGQDGRGVTLATHCSVQHLHKVTDMAHQWQGPVSVSVFALNHEVQWLVQALLQLRSCHASITANVSFSVVMPLTLTPPLPRRKSGGEFPLAVLLAPLSERRLHSHRDEEWRALLDTWRAVGEEGLSSRGRNGSGDLMILEETLWSMNNKGRKINSSDLFTEGVQYSMKYSRRKLNKNKNDAKYRGQNYFSDLSVNNVDSQRNEKLSVARNYKKHNGRLEANLHANYRYVSNSKRAASIIKSSPDSTPCDRVPDLSNLSPIAASAASRSPVDRNYDLPGVEYPNNLLRNAAVRAVDTPFVLVLDIDMLPSEGLRQHFVDFATKRKLKRRFDFKFRLEDYKDTSDDLLTANFNAAKSARPPPFGLDKVSFTPEDKVAFVLPAYEVKEEVPLPRTKEQLLKLVNTGQARPFYDDLCRKCQRPTNYSAWESLPPPPPPTTNSSLVAAFEVLWRDPWEPFYITATDTMPRYDERFRQYGFNRISQVCEAHVSGHLFVVLSAGFVVHRGFKEKGHDRATKEQEQHRNRMIFRQFKQELKLRYPLSNRRCY